MLYSIRLFIEHKNNKLHSEIRVTIDLFTDLLNKICKYLQIIAKIISKRIFKISLF